MTTEPVVLCAVDARGIATLSLNRPDMNNAYNGAMLEQLVAHVGALMRDAAVRVLVLRGNGRHFQAGADLGWLQAVSRDTPEANIAASRLTAEAVRGLDQCAKPTVALVQGACVGGGTGVIAACDVVIAEQSATFAISEARWGVAATVIFPQLNQAIGIRHVRRYAQTCERIGAEEARRIGLVHEVCEPAAWTPPPTPLSKACSRPHPVPSRSASDSAMRCAGALISADDFDRLVQEHADRRQSDEASEGFASFHEKRDASWYPGPT